MSIAVVMPQLGLTMEEGTVSAWLKKTGDSVKKDELLFSVSTDKVEMDVESVAEGVLGEIMQLAGSTVPVGTVLAYIRAPGEDGAAANQPLVGLAPEKSAPADQFLAQPALAQASDNGGSLRRKAERLVSPRAKRLAAERGIDLSAVQGNAPGGEITEQDIRRIAGRDKDSSRSDGLRRRLIAERLTRSIQTIPAFSVAAEVNAENLVALYSTLKASLPTSFHAKPTITDLLLSVFAAALSSSPEMNAVWKEDEVLNQNSVDIGVAVATEKGVVAPVIRNVDALGLADVAVRRSELVEKARTRRLSLADMNGGVGTLSNLGMYRVDHFQAIISPGQSSILAVGQIRERPWVDKTLMVKRTLMLNLTVDHRLADGAAAAELLGKMIDLIESPEGHPGKLNSFRRDSAREGD